jgi:hydrogenase maturation protease
LLGDDGVGIRVAAIVRAAVDREGVDVEEAAVGGIRFLEMILGYDRVVVADALQSGPDGMGRIRRFESCDAAAPRHLGCVHDVGYFEAVSLGRKLGLPVPDIITVYGVGVGDCATFRERLSPPVETAAAELARIICRELEAFPTDAAAPRDEPPAKSHAQSTGVAYET